VRTPLMSPCHPGHPGSYAILTSRLPSPCHPERTRRHSRVLTQTLKAHVLLPLFSARLKPCPDTKQSADRVSGSLQPATSFVSLKNQRWR
jgi:hypothetical protein